MLGDKSLGDKSSNKVRKAVVIGGSTSGLLAAHVLSRHFDQVLILEKDQALSKTARKGLPQASHQHLVLSKGKQLFEAFFPGFDQTLADHGAPLVDYSKDVDLYIGHGKLPRFPSQHQLRACRRELLDQVMRCYVTKASNLVIQSGVKVKGLSAEGKRVNGVLVDGVVMDGKRSDDLIAADLVIDCSGRGSQALTWLDKLGLPVSIETRVKPDLAYSSVLMKPRANSESNKAETDALRALEIAPHAPDLPHAVGLWPVERGPGDKGALDKASTEKGALENGSKDNEQWLLTLIGIGDAKPPRDLSALLDYGQNIGNASLSRALNQLEPISEVTHYRATENVWKRFDKAPQKPDGFIVMGDALCAFNPLYGQGLSLLAMSAQLLEQRLAQGVDQNFSAQWCTRVYRRLNRLFIPAWMIAISEDMRWPSTQGRIDSVFLRISYKYMDWLVEACEHSSGLTARCLDVANLTRSPLSLVSPQVLLILLMNRVARLFKSFSKEQVAREGI